MASMPRTRSSVPWSWPKSEGTQPSADGASEAAVSVTWCSAPRESASSRESREVPLVMRIFMSSTLHGSRAAYSNISLMGIRHPGTASPTSSTSASVSTMASV